MSDFKRLAEADLEVAVTVMSSAFQDDPLWRYLLTDAARRAESLRRFFRPVLKFAILNEQCFGAADPIEGVAVWSAPNDKSTSLRTVIQSGLPSVLLSPLALSFVKALKVFARFDAAQKRYAPLPHFYLNTIGVLPQAQGRGLASKLIRPFLDQADELAVAVYTETVTPANVGLYEYFGFKVVERYAVPKTPLTLWSFLRPASRPDNPLT
jgi:ribosomal protein S18 acetylase RimI-like enzyme